jgi:hypothetical protein
MPGNTGCNQIMILLNGRQLNLQSLWFPIPRAVSTPGPSVIQKALPEETGGLSYSESDLVCLGLQFSV